MKLDPKSPHDSSLIRMTQLRIAVRADAHRRRAENARRPVETGQSDLGRTNSNQSPSIPLNIVRQVGVDPFGAGWFLLGHEMDTS